MSVELITNPISYSELSPGMLIQNGHDLISFFRYDACICVSVEKKLSMMIDHEQIYYLYHVVWLNCLTGKLWFDVGRAREIINT